MKIPEPHEILAKPELIQSPSYPYRRSSIYNEKSEREIFFSWKDRTFAVGPCRCWHLSVFGEDIRVSDLSTPAKRRLIFSKKEHDVIRSGHNTLFRERCIDLWAILKDIIISQKLVVDVTDSLVRDWEIRWEELS